MTPRVDECDVLVIGAGPAGSTAAQLLASWGRSVTVVHRPTAPQLTLAESLPASTRKLLGFLGHLDRVDAAGFYPNTGNRAEWAGATRVTTSADAGFHVSRATFDRVLRDGAHAAGARVIDATVRRIDDSGPVRVESTTPDGQALQHLAQYVLDCSGRAGVIARGGLRRTRVAYRTLAIVAEWQCDDWPVDGTRPYTTIESYPEGWAWSVPLSHTRRQCTVMIDPPSPGRSRASTGAGAAGLETLYESELAKASALTTRLAQARRVSAPWTCDAALYDSIRAADGRLFLVGDAASFIEPLSSAGVKKALLSAWRAAVVTNTCLANPAMAGSATELFVQREHEVYDDCLRRASGFFAEASAAYATEFWRARTDLSTAAADSTSAVDSDDISDDALGRDESIRVAFEQIRAEDGVRLRPADTLRFASVPTIEGREVVMREAVVVPGFASPLHYAAGVDLARLTRIAARCDDVPAIIAAYQDHVGPVPLAGLLTGLSLLVARRALVPEERRAQG